jgi:hypothetical protein
VDAKYHLTTHTQSNNALPGTVKYKGKTCHLCDIGDDGPGLDLWHALFECDVTRDHPTFVTVRGRCQELLPQLCDEIEEAVAANADSMNDSRNAGVDHVAITDAATAVRAAAPAYHWDCLPGQWLMYMLLLAMPYPAHVVHPDAGAPVWLCKPKRRWKGAARERDLTGMPQPGDIPALDALQQASRSRILLVGSLIALCFQITPFAELQTSGAITARAAFRISGEWSALYALLPR